MLKQSLILALCFSLAFPVNVVLAAPSGGRVVRGQAAINQSGATTTINQSSNRAIVNWKNFDIGRNEAVRHNMPSPNSAALHRVVGGGGASRLAGELKSNGNIFLVNPAGVVIHKGARIDTGGFMATTHDIANEDFMQGNYAFTKPGHPGAAVVNRGNISVRDQGFAALVAPTVRNEGVIAARLGKVALASGDAFTLDFHGDDLINFTVPESTVDRLHTTDGTPLGVDNSGTVKAEGGVVLLSAAQLDGVVSSVVNNSGMVNADSAELRGGRIVFGGTGTKVDVVNTGTVTANSGAGDGGSVRMAADGKVAVSGHVEAKGAGRGGTVDISGTKETLVAGAKIAAEGREGGLIRLGGEFQGGKAVNDKSAADETMRSAFVDRFAAGELYSTDTLFVDSASTINAGRDGTLIAWSDGRTELYGGLTGKYAETSGKDLTVSSAPQLTGGGTWLIDPENVDIVNGGGQAIDGNTIDAAWLGDYIANLERTVFIRADDTISIKNNMSYAEGGLDLTAGTINIEENVEITGEGGWLSLSSGIIDVQSEVRIENKQVNWRADTINIGSHSHFTSDSDIFLYATKNISISDGVDIRAQESFLLGEGGASMRPGYADITIGKNVYIACAMEGSYYPEIDIMGRSLTMDAGSQIIGEKAHQYFSCGSIAMASGSRIASKSSIDMFADSLTVSGTIESNSFMLVGQGASQVSLNNGARISGNNVYLYANELEMNSASIDGAYNLVFAGAGVAASPSGPAASVTLSGNSSIKNFEYFQLYTNSLAFDSLATATPIDVKKIALFTDAPLVLEAGGTELRPWIKAETTEFAKGSFELYPYAVNTKNIYWNQGVTLTGKPDGNTTEPHIFGVEGLRYYNSTGDTIYSTALTDLLEAFPSMVLSDAAGTVVVPAAPVDPDLPFPIPPGMSENDLRTKETELYWYYFLRNHTPGYTFSNENALGADYLALIARLAQADFDNVSDAEFAAMKAANDLYGKTRETMRSALGESYAMLMTEAALRRVGEERYMVAYLKAADAAYTHDGDWNKLVKQYAIAFAAHREAHAVEAWLADIRVLDPDYIYQDGTTASALQAVYDSLRQRMIALVRQHSDNSSWSPAGDAQLHDEFVYARGNMLAVVRYYKSNQQWNPADDNTLMREFGSARSGMALFITEWLGLGADQIPSDKLIALHRQALEKKEAAENPPPQPDQQQIIDRLLADLKVIHPYYTYKGAMTPEAIRRVYNDVHYQMRTLLNEYAGSRYDASTPPDVLKRRFEGRSSSIKDFISDKLGASAAPSETSSEYYYRDMLSAYRAARDSSVPGVEQNPDIGKEPPIEQPAPTGPKSGAAYGWPDYTFEELYYLGFGAYVPLVYYEAGKKLAEDLKNMMGESFNEKYLITHLLKNYTEEELRSPDLAEKVRADIEAEREEGGDGNGDEDGGNTPPVTPPVLPVKTSEELRRDAEQARDDARAYIEDKIRALKEANLTEQELAAQLEQLKSGFSAIADIIGKPGEISGWVDKVFKWVEMGMSYTEILLGVQALFPGYPQSLYKSVADTIITGRSLALAATQIVDQLTGFFQDAVIGMATDALAEGINKIDELGRAYGSISMKTGAREVIKDVLGGGNDPAFKELVAAFNPGGDLNTNLGAALQGMPYSTLVAALGKIESIDWSDPAAQIAYDQEGRDAINTYSQRILAMWYESNKDLLTKEPNTPEEYTALSDLLK